MKLPSLNADPPAIPEGKQPIGAPVPDFSLPALSGGTRSLSGTLEGTRGGVVVFWSGVCSHCVRYDGYLNTFAERHPELGFFAVASRLGETLAELQTTAADRCLTFPILHDVDAAVASAWLVQQTPRVFLVDGSHRLLYRGAIDNYKYPEDPDFLPYLEPAIEAFLAGRPVERTETASFGCAIRSIYYVMPKPL